MLTYALFSAHKAINFVGVFLLASSVFAQCYAMPTPTDETLRVYLQLASCKQSLGVWTRWRRTATVGDSLQLGCLNIQSRRSCSVRLSYKTVVV